MWNIVLIRNTWINQVCNKLHFLELFELLHVRICPRQPRIPVPSWYTDKSLHLPTAGGIVETKDIHTRSILTTCRIRPLQLVCR